MNMPWISAFYEELHRLSVKPEEFAEIISRLFNYGAICREDSQVEGRLYERLLRCEEMANDYLKVLGFYLHHNDVLEYFRLYPPGSAPTGIPFDEAPTASFSARPPRAFVTLLLVLRFIYEQKMSQGDLTDASEAPCTLEEINSVMQQTLSQSLPDAAQDRKSMLSQAMRAKALIMPTDRHLSAQDDLIYIRPHILELITDDHLNGILKQTGGQEAEGEAQATTHVD